MSQARLQQRPSGARIERSSDPDNPGGFKHVPALDGIRGLAILLVLFDHLFWSNPHTGNRVLDFFAKLREASFVGVNLFFALSGLLITGILLDSLKDPHFFKNFYARRALRIFPLYYGLLILLLLLTRPLHYIWNGWQYFLLTYVANLVTWQRAAPILPHMNINHFWSLQVEEQFYLVWPFVVYRVQKLKSLINISLITCAVILVIRILLTVYKDHFANPYLTYSPTYSCADNLLFGCCLAILLRTHWRARIIAWAPRVFALATLGVIAMAIAHNGLTWMDNFITPTFGFSLIGIASASLLAMALKPHTFTASFFSAPVLRFFGKYSYGLYVFHYPMDAILTPGLRAFFKAHTHSNFISVSVSAVLTATSALLIALVSYHFFELRFLKLKNKFSYRH